MACSQPAPLVRAPKENIWGSLTASESTAIVKWLLQRRELNLTATPAPSSDNGTESIASGFGFFGHAWDNTMVVFALVDGTERTF